MMNRAIKKFETNNHVQRVVDVIAEEIEKTSPYVFLNKLMAGDFDDNFFNDRDLIGDNSGRELPKLSSIVDPSKISNKNFNLQTECAIKLYESLNHLSENDASDPRLWMYTNLYVYRSFIYKRWGFDKEAAYRKFQDRFMYTTPSYNTNVRTSICDYWWAVHKTHDPSLEDPYKYTRMLFENSDVFQNITQRLELFPNKNVLRGLLEFVKSYSSSGSNNTLFRKLIVYFHNHIKLFDTRFMSKEEISEMYASFAGDYKKKQNSK